MPPLSVVGLSEEQAAENANGDILVFTSTFNPMKNTISGYMLVQVLLYMIIMCERVKQPKMHSLLLELFSFV